MKKLKSILSMSLIKLLGGVQFFRQPFFCVLWGDTHYKIKGKDIREIIKNLKAGDVLLRRYDRYVSGWFIPGFWTHAAIAVNNELVIHATTDGVSEEDIFTFIRADHIAILRCPDSEAIEVAIDVACSMVGRNYDFLFDSIDDERLYCSELIKWCYPGMLEDPKGKAIIPDSIMNSGLQLIHDSREFRKNQRGE